MSLPIQKESLNFLNYFFNPSRSNLINHPFCCIGQIGFFFLLRKKNFCATKLCVKSLPKLLHFLCFQNVSKSWNSHNCRKLRIMDRKWSSGFRHIFTVAFFLFLATARGSNPAEPIFQPAWETIINIYLT